MHEIPRPAITIKLMTFWSLEFRIPFKVAHSDQISKTNTSALSEFLGNLSGWFWCEFSYKLFKFRGNISNCLHIRRVQFFMPSFCANVVEAQQTNRSQTLHFQT